VTPFDTWYTANVAPTLPNDAPEIVLKAARDMMAWCWNAAHELAAVEAAQMRKAVMDYYGENLPPHLKAFLYERLAVIHNARVIP
jgi:hypothetical protein